MKSSLRLDEIFGMPPQMKLNPSSYPDEVGFHHEVISSHDSGIYPSPNSWRCQLRTDLVKKESKSLTCSLFSGGATRNRTGDRGVADLCLTAWLWRRSARKGEGKLPRSVYIQKHPCGCLCLKKTGTIIRARVWSGLRGSNPPPPPWQGGALPNELNPHMVPPVGIEPTTRGFSVPCSTN